MNRPIKALALAAFALAAAFGATTAQASATNFSVSFKIKNLDPLQTSYSMIRISSIPSTVSGLINPASAIARLGTDPGSGTGTYADTLPLVNHFTQVSLTYANASDSVSQQCTFTIRVSRDSNSLPYLVHFTSDQARCAVPGDARTSDGQFTATPFEMDWSSS
jgi:hypothetical protein